MTRRISTRVCVAGGGPAGLILGLLLARAGIPVVVLEKHADFLRDFRGDTIHPTTLDLLRDLGLADRVDAVPHSEVKTLDTVLNGVRFTTADFGAVGASGRLWFMPQWDLLDAIAQAGAEHPGFELLMSTEATELLIDAGDRVVGVRARSRSESGNENGDGELEVSAEVVVAADGRDSVLRSRAGLELVETGVPVDVQWFRVDRPEQDPPDTIAYIAADTVITIPRTDYYQCALLVPKGSDAALRSEGIGAFRERIAAAVPFLEPTLDGLDSWDAVRLLDVRIAHAPRWSRAGLTLIGDAAHPMSPAFGVGINYAVQDAVATARELVSADRGPSSDTETGTDAAGHTDRAADRPADLGDAALLARVQARRAGPVLRMQRIQRVVHRTVGRRLGARRLPPRPLVRVIAPVVGRIARRRLGRLVGAGFRPERLDF